MYVFGGTKKTQQISIVENCKLTLIGQLKWDMPRKKLEMQKGVCTNVDNKQVFICFNSNDPTTWRKCLKANEPLASFGSIFDVNDSDYTHRNTRIANDGGEA